MSWLAKVAERVRPEAIATLAYEGGHPDHDCCSVLGARLGERLGVPVWETAVYSRGRQVSKFQGFKVSEVKGKGEGRGVRTSHICEKRADVGHPADPTSAKSGQMWGTQLIRMGSCGCRSFCARTGRSSGWRFRRRSWSASGRCCAQYESQQGELLQSFDLAARGGASAGEIRLRAGSA